VLPNLENPKEGTISMAVETKDNNMNINNNNNNNLIPLPSTPENGKKKSAPKESKKKKQQKKEETLWSSKEFQSFEEMVKRGETIDTIQKTLNKDLKDVENKLLTYERAGLYKSSFEKKN